jgi:F-type H+-transporting ATPase subunit b
MLTVITTAADDGHGESATNPFLPADYDIIWSLVPFALIVAFFLLFALPRFRKILDERAEKIEGGLARAEAAQAEAKATLEAYNEQLAEARAEANRIREQARADGQQILAEMREQAQADATRIAQQAQAQIAAERQAAVASLRAEVGTLAVDLASGIIGDSLDATRSGAVVDRFLAELEAEQKTEA